MTLQSLYAISDLKYSDGEFSAEIAFDPDHEIFSGHFPGRPVVPGVCLIELVKKICGMVIGYDVQLSRVSNIKFLRVIDPTDNKTIAVNGTIKQGESRTMVVNATISDDEAIYFKFKGTLNHVTV